MRSQHVIFKREVESTDCEMCTMCYLLQMHIHIHGDENTILDKKDKEYLRYNHNIVITNYIDSNIKLYASYVHFVSQNA